MKLRDYYCIRVNYIPVVTNDDVIEDLATYRELYIYYDIPTIWIHFYPEKCHLSTYHRVINSPQFDELRQFTNVLYKVGCGGGGGGCEDTLKEFEPNNKNIDKSMNGPGVDLVIPHKDNRNRDKFDKET